VTVVVDGSSSLDGVGYGPCDANTPLPPPPSGTFILDPYAFGTVNVTNGDALSLTVRCSGLPWAAPTAEPPLFLDALAMHGGGLYAHYVAARSGSATVRTQQDATCFYVATPCTFPVRQLIVDVRVLPAGSGCIGRDLTAASSARYGNTVAVSGTASPGTEVEVYFRGGRLYEFSRRRVLTAGASGAFATSFSATEDYAYYATAGGCTSAIRTVAVLPTISGPQVVVRGTTVRLTVHAPNYGRVSVYFHRAGSSGYQLRRTGFVESFGTFTTTYRADADYRYYATYRAADGGLRTSNIGLTQVR
ncbi:MAG: hypothetical protein LC640_05265, partial [Frankia sp.]|nr:hypothetical protein [Frankia sp.]